MSNINNNATTNNRLLVYVRVKPVVDERSVIDVIDDRTLVFDPVSSEDRTNDQRKQGNNIGVKKSKNTTYIFDKVFSHDSGNLEIFQQVTRPMVDATISGHNCCVFAYGATGSGKTYTMLGRRGEPGVIYHTTKDLYEKLSVISDKDAMPAELKICYFEIYNERIRDLLVPDGHNRRGCEALSGGQSLLIPDLTYHTPENAEQLIELLEAGNANRSQHPTDANADSSRSHAIFQIVLTRRLRRLNGDGNQHEVQDSKMSLIDLAGSERASVAYRIGNDRSKDLQREGGNINRSLLALGVCITALANQRNGHTHIPYRNSMLTRLLRDSLGGKSRTAMIATVCQQRSYYEDTQNTLAYASRAMSISLAEDDVNTTIGQSNRKPSDIDLEAVKSELEFQIRNEVALEFRRETEKIREEYKKVLGDKDEQLLNVKQSVNELKNDKELLCQQIAEYKQALDAKDELLLSANRSFDELQDKFQDLMRQNSDLQLKIQCIERNVDDKESNLRILREKLDNCSCMQHFEEPPTEKKTKKATAIRKQVPMIEEVNDYANMTFDNDDEIIQVSAKKPRQKIPAGKKMERKELTMSGKKKRLRTTEDDEVSLSPISPPVRQTRTRTGATRRKLY